MVLLFAVTIVSIQVSRDVHSMSAAQYPHSGSSYQIWYSSRLQFYGPVI